jgi:hypothetical protein
MAGFVLVVILGWVVLTPAALFRAVCPPTEAQLFVGITYGCEHLTGSGETGSLHWARIDLAAPGIGLYVTPLDRVALEQGWQYRLRWIGSVVTSEHLAVVINGALFTSNSLGKLRLPGDLANGVETVVADHVVSHVWEHTYLLWFDDDLTPNIETTKPPRPAALKAAKWGIGGQGIGLHDGQLYAGLSRSPDARTAVAIDRSRKQLFLAIAEDISPYRMLEKLAGLGAQDGMMLDGGGSTSMAIGEGASGVSAGVVFGGWRPVATHFGVRAQSIR